MAQEAARQQIERGGHEDSGERAEQAHGEDPRRKELQDERLYPHIGPCNLQVRNDLPWRLAVAGEALEGDPRDLGFVCPKPGWDFAEAEETRCGRHGRHGDDGGEHAAARGPDGHGRRLRRRGGKDSREQRAAKKQKKPDPLVMGDEENLPRQRRGCRRDRRGPRVCSQSISPNRSSHESRGGFPGTGSYVILGESVTLR